MHFVWGLIVILHFWACAGFASRNRPAKNFVTQANSVVPFQNGYRIFNWTECSYLDISPLYDSGLDTVSEWRRFTIPPMGFRPRSAVQATSLSWLLLDTFSGRFCRYSSDMELLGCVTLSELFQDSYMKTWSLIEVEGGRILLLNEENATLYQIAEEFGSLKIRQSTVLPGMEIKCLGKPQVAKLLCQTKDSLFALSPGLRALAYDSSLLSKSSWKSGRDGLELRMIIRDTLDSSRRICYSMRHGWSDPCIEPP